MTDNGIPGSEPAPGLVGMGFDSSVHPRQLNFDEQAHGLVGGQFAHPYLAAGHAQDAPGNLKIDFHPPTEGRLA